MVGPRMTTNRKSIIPLQPTASRRRSRACCRGPGPARSCRRCHLSSRCRGRRECRRVRGRRLTGTKEQQHDGPEPHDLDSTATQRRGIARAAWWGEADPPTLRPPGADGDRATDGMRSPYRVRSLRLRRRHARGPRRPPRCSPRPHARCPDGADSRCPSAPESVPKCSGIGAQVPGTGAQVRPESVPKSGRNRCPSQAGIGAQVRPENAKIPRIRTNWPQFSLLPALGQ